MKKDDIFPGSKVAFRKAVVYTQIRRIFGEKILLRVGEICKIHQIVFDPLPRMGKVQKQSHRNLPNQGFVKLFCLKRLAEFGFLPELQPL